MGSVVCYASISSCNDKNQQTSVRECLPVTGIVFCAFRFDHLSFSPNTASFLHFKVLALLGTVILFSMLIFVTVSVLGCMSVFGR